VTSTIIGARTMQQLDDNVKALDVRLSQEHVPALDRLSAPKLDFPADFLKMGPVFINGGTTVNGESAPVWPLAPQSDEDRY
jgi:hypothetical protein